MRFSKPFSKPFSLGLLKQPAACAPVCTLLNNQKTVLRILAWGLFTISWAIEPGIADPLDKPLANRQVEEKPQENVEDQAADNQENGPPQLPVPEGAVALPKPDRVWIDKKNRLVMVDGYVSLREGYLEMFACSAGTKEHESVVAVNAQAHVVHAALLVLGIKPGQPVRFYPEFSPPTGAQIQVDVLWLDAQKKWQSTPAQQWVLDTATNKVLDQPWLFAGSGFWKDETTGIEYYQADAGDFICVSNFSTAMLDLPIESSKSDELRTYQANTNRIPPLGTPVRLVMKEIPAGEGK